MRWQSCLFHQRRKQAYVIHMSGPKGALGWGRKATLEGHPVQLASWLPKKEVESAGSLMSGSPWGDNGSPSIDEK